MATNAADFFPPKFAQWPLYLPDAQPVEGIRATGTNALEEIIYGVIP